MFFSIPVFQDYNTPHDVLWSIMNILCLLAALLSLL